ncbi:MAG TPA: MlaD family protein [Longimicrobiales bacterium]
MTVERGDGRDYDPEMLVPPKRGGRQLMVGAFVLVGIIAIILALFSLTDPGTFRGRYVLYTVVDNAGGIRKGDQVQIRGVNVGRVKSFKIGASNVVVALELEKAYKVPSDSRMTLTSSGLLGGMTATINPGRSATELADGDTIVGVREAGAFDNAASLGQRADTVLARTQALLSNQMVSDLNASGAQLRALLSQTAAMVAEDRATIRALTRSLASTSAELQAGHPGQRIAATTARLDSLTNQLNATSTRLSGASASLQVVLSRLEKGEGTLGKLSADPTLYNNLNAAASNFRDLAQDIKANPKKYINVKVF